MFRLPPPTGMQLFFFWGGGPAGFAKGVPFGTDSPPWGRDVAPATEWGTAVERSETEGVRPCKQHLSGRNPFRHFALRNATCSPLCPLRGHLPPAGGSLSTQVEALAKAEGFWDLLLGGSPRQRTLSVTASPCHLSREGEALARAGGLLVLLLGGSPSQSTPAALPACSPFCRLTATSSPGRGKSFKGRAKGVSASQCVFVNL